MPTIAYKNLSDEELIHRFFEKKDEKAYTALFNRYVHLAIGVCLKYLKSNDLAKDAVQNVFSKLWTDADQFKIRKFKSWFYEVLKNHCLMELRKKNNNHTLIADWEVDFMDNDDNLHHKIKQEQLLNFLSECMASLNAPQQNCIQKFYLEKKSYQETAILLHFNLHEVKSHLQNGRRNLKSCLNQKWSKSNH